MSSLEGSVFTVSALNSRIKQLIDSEPGLSGLYVRGELSNYKIYPSGHHYFTLKDEESSLRCVMFRSSASKLRYKPENGMRVTAFGSVSVYPRDGAYQLYCTALTPEGMGDLHVAFEQLKAKLAAEGLFDSAHKKAIPRFPDKIAIITSQAGAAVRDMIRVMGKRWPMAKLIIIPVRVQGAEAPAEISAAIKYANAHDVGDIIITGRGGGSIEDLWAFNDERVARAIFASHIPVISAVGHEPDITISDYVADLRAATPSNAGELAVADSSEITDAIMGFSIRLKHAGRKKISELSSKLSELAGRRVLSDPSVYIDDKKQRLDYEYKRLTMSLEALLARRSGEFSRRTAAFDALSPLKVLARGYSIAEKEDGCLLRESRQVSIGETLRIRLSSGELGCNVFSIKHEEKDG